MTQARDQLADRWLTAAEDALTRNQTTFAVLPIIDLLKPDGPLAKLRQAGNTIADP
jgi:hypothetical protein